MYLIYNATNGANGVPMSLIVYFQYRMHNLIEENRSFGLNQKFKSLLKSFSILAE